MGTMFKGLLHLFRKQQEPEQIATVVKIEEDKIEPNLIFLKTFIGQQNNVSMLIDQIKGSATRNKLCGHILLFGDAGYGKTTLAKVISEVYGTPFVQLSGMNVFPRTLTEKLHILRKNSILFIDEVHGLSNNSQEVLYEAMQDGSIDGVPISPFILVAATTRPGSLNKPFRDRFGLHLKMSEYSIVELMDIIDEATTPWKHGSYFEEHDDDLKILEEIAKRSKGIPRVGIQIGKAVINRFESDEDDDGLKESFIKVIEQMGIEKDGLDRRDMEYLKSIKERGNASLATIAACMSEHIDDIYSIEAYLIKQGLVTVTSRGRILTDKGKARLGNF